MAQQTAVDFLLNELDIAKLIAREKLTMAAEVVRQAKQMEKKQIMKAVYDAMGTNFDPNMGRAEQYYNENYNK